MRIALFGKIRAGKSITIEALMEQFEKLGYTTEHIEFGDPVGEVVATVYPWLEGIKHRESYIEVGQHLRKLNKDIWVDCIRYKIQNSKADIVFVGGVRQKNEYEMLKSLGFTFIEVMADEETRIRRCIEAGDKFERESFKDDTERVMDTFESNYCILNIGSENELKENVIDMVKSLVFRGHFESNIKKNLFGRINSK
ncbi:hypothetical protein UT300003_33020 [Clostridium sardiniense]